MNNFKKLTFIAVTALASASAFSQSVPVERKASNDNWISEISDSVWMNGTNEMCWRNAFWKPGTANAKCDGAIMVQAPTPPVPTKPAPVPIISRQKVTYQADALFEFNKAILKRSAYSELDNLVERIKNVNLEVIVATGYTDRVGSNRYNDRLSLQRAEAVKNYMVEKGINASKIYVEGKGKHNSITGSKCRQRNRKLLIECLKPDRRVEIEVVGTQQVYKQPS